MPKKKIEGVEYRPAIHTDWAILNKDTGMCIAIFNPEGKIPALRRVGISVAREAGLSFTKVTLIPVGMMSPEKIESSKVFEAPRAVDPNPKK
jgi:hypothetical protein